MKAISGKHLCRVLERMGWSLVHIRGAHHKYRRAGFHPVVVPVHGNKALKIGTQRAIMRDVGLSEADL